MDLFDWGPESGSCLVHKYEQHKFSIEPALLLLRISFSIVFTPGFSTHCIFFSFGPPILCSRLFFIISFYHFSGVQDPLGEFTSENMSSFERLLVHALSAYNALNSYSKKNATRYGTVDSESKIGRKSTVLTKLAVFRIGFEFNQVRGFGPRRAKMTHKTRKKLGNFMFWSAGCSLLRAEGFFCNVGFLSGGLGMGKLYLAFFLSKQNLFF